MSDTTTELRYAKKGLDQIHQAYEDGEYDNLSSYDRDVKNQVNGIEQLEKKLERENKRD